MRFFRKFIKKLTRVWSQPQTTKFSNRPLSQMATHRRYISQKIKQISF